MNIGYFIGLWGMWTFCDGLISIRLYLNSKDETGKKAQNWRDDHSIRILRCLGGIFLMVVGYIAS